MKKIIFITSILLSVSTIFGQEVKNLDGYLYVHIYPTTYNDGQIDIYGIMSYVKEIFVDKGFGYIPDISKPDKIFNEIKENPCLLLFCSINHESPSPYTNAELVLTFTNCYNQVVYKTKGKGGMASTYQQYFKKATKNALQDFTNHIYKYNSDLTPKIIFPEVEKTNETETSLKKYFDENPISEIEGIYKSYQSDGLGYYKIGIKKFGTLYKGIIIDSDYKHWKAGEVKAIFEPSSMKKIYSTKWFMGNKTEFQTFSVIENSALLNIEFIDPKTGNKNNDKFIKMYPSVVINDKITKEGLKATGSGFIVSTDGVIATNAHVIEDATKIEIILTNELGTSTYSAKLLLKDLSNDVALIKIDENNFKGFNTLPYQIIDKTETGEDVFTIGYPLNSLMGDNFKVTNGIISSLSGLKDDLRYLQTTTPIQPGNSGGPLFNKDGNIVGITTAKLNGKAVGVSIENVNYAIKSTYLLNIYNMLPTKESLSTTSSLTKKELKDQIKILKNYVCLIKVY